MEETYFRFQIFDLDGNRKRQRGAGTPLTRPVMGVPGNRKWTDTCRNHSRSSKSLDFFRRNFPYRA